MISQSLIRKVKSMLFILTVNILLLLVLAGQVVTNKEVLLSNLILSIVATVVTLGSMHYMLSSILKHDL